MARLKLRILLLFFFVKTLFSQNNEQVGLCLCPAHFLSGPTLSVRPDRSCFFRYEEVTFSCSVKGDPSGWTVKRNASSGPRLPCDSGWGMVNGSSCTIRGMYMSDSGSYWCESEKDERSNVVDIIVSSDTVILESPVLPVDQGDPVSLRCLHRDEFDKEHTTGFEASFYKDGVFIGKYSQGLMHLSKVSRDHRGLYKCQHLTKGQSLEVPLSVKEEPKNNKDCEKKGLSAGDIAAIVLGCFIIIIIIISAIVFYKKYRRGHQQNFDFQFSAIAQNADQPPLRPNDENQTNRVNEEIRLNDLPADQSTNQQQPSVQPSVQPVNEEVPLNNQ